MLTDSYRRTVLLCAAPTILIALAGCEPPIQKKPNGIDLAGAQYGRDFLLRDADGAKRRLSDFKGKAVLLFFGLTQCSDSGHLALRRAAEVKKILGEDANRLEVVFITLDPDRDTPEVLKTYLSAIDASFVGLSGSPQEIAKTAMNFKISYKRVPAELSCTLRSPTISYLYDDKGALRVGVPHGMTAQIIAADIRLILNNNRTLV